MQVIVDSLLTQYETVGSGTKTLLNLHGWADSSKGFELLNSQLASEYKIISLNLPGFGGSAAPKGVWKLDDYASFVAAFLKKLDTIPYAVVGHSNGGAIAVRGIAMGLLKPKRLVLISSAGIRKSSSQSFHRLVWGAVAKTGKAASLALPARMRRKLRSRLYKVAGSDMLVAEDLQETFKKVVSQDIKDDAAKLTLPVLLIYGDQDTATPVNYAKTFAGLIKSSKLTILPGAGHFVHQQQSVEVADEIKRFLQ